MIYFIDKLATIKPHQYAFIQLDYNSEPSVS